jgi:hypothetical protein
MNLKLTLILLLALPAPAQEAIHQPAAVDASVQNQVDPVTNYFPETPYAPPSPKTGATSFTPLRPVYKTQPSIWFRPLQYSPPPPSFLAKPTAKLPLTLEPTIQLPPSLPALSSPFFMPGFNSAAPVHYKPAAKNRPRKTRTPSTPSPAR